MEPWLDRSWGLGPAAVRRQYFYAQGHSLAFHYTDDIEMKLDNNKERYSSAPAHAWARLTGTWSA